MGESRLVVEELLALCLQRITIEETSMSTEQELVAVVKRFEAARKRWMQAEVEMKKFKELLVKSDVAKAALEVKLKHTRNQLDLEMKKRHRVEADYQNLQRQMQLVFDVLVQDSTATVTLNEKQKNLLATFEQRGHKNHQRSRRLSVIDESSFLSHSDISYDRTDDDLDLDTTVIKPLKSRIREKRRSSMGAGGASGCRRGRGNVSAEPLETEVEVVVASVLPPESRAEIHTQENHDQGDQTSVWLPLEDSEVEAQGGTAQKHDFLSKTVIRPETCPPCGRRIRFGKVASKCRRCRAVAHPECKTKLQGCRQGSLEGFAPAVHPQVPSLIVACVSEIESRGLQERGLYRVSGGERPVRELRLRFLQGKTPPLGRVDVHAVCGVLKDFLRRLPEPLLTFRLHHSFMQAAELADEANSAAVIYRAIAELPKANRDTLAFLMLHLHKVMRSPQCQMDQNNLARVFGPTIVGHGMAEPSPTTIMRDTNTQPKVISRMLSLPEAYWRRILADHHGNATAVSHDDAHGGRLFKPLTSPELNSFYKTGGRGSVRDRIRNQTSTGRFEPGRRFFTSPS